MHRPLLMLAAVGAALWWLNRNDKAAPAVVDGTTSSNPAIAGGDSYGQLTTVDVQFAPDGSSADVVVDTRDLGPRIGPQQQLNAGLVVIDPVSRALALPVEQRVVRAELPVRVAQLRPAAVSMQPRVRFSL